LLIVFPKFSEIVQKLFPVHDLKVQTFFVDDG
jgi:hypothetical protein